MAHPTGLDCRRVTIRRILESADGPGARESVDDLFAPRQVGIDRIAQRHLDLAHARQGKGRGRDDLDCFAWREVQCASL